jgi:hypothetical protein
MDWQQIINGFGAITLSVMGWLARQLWDSVQELKEEIAALRLHISESYVKKSEIEMLRIDMDKRFDKLEQMIGRFFDKIETKVDK